MSKILASEIKVLLFVPVLFSHPGAGCRASQLRRRCQTDGHGEVIGWQRPRRSHRLGPGPAVKPTRRLCSPTKLESTFSLRWREEITRIWAQAVGFETARAERKLEGSSGTSQDFELRTLADFSQQLSGTEWIAALPEDTSENRRMKVLFRNNCSGCHTPNLVLQNRFDEAGWRSIITLMEKVGIYGNPPRPDGAPFPFLSAPSRTRWPLI